MTDEIKEPYEGAFTEKTTVQTTEGTPWAEGEVWPNLDTVNTWLKEQGGLKLSPDLRWQRVTVAGMIRRTAAYHAIRDAHTKEIQDAFNASLKGTREERLADPFGDYLDHEAYEARLKEIFKEGSGG